MTDPLLDYDMVIGGQPRAARSGRTYESLDPYRGTAWARVPDAGAGDVDDAVAAARDALEGPWAQLTATRRGPRSAGSGRRRRSGGRPSAPGRPRRGARR